jgi:hypothetical protein
MLPFRVAVDEGSTSIFVDDIDVAAAGKSAENPVSARVPHKEPVSRLRPQ